MSQQTEKPAGAWMLPLVANQILAYSILLISGVIISVIIWCLFLAIGGVNLPNILYWIIALFIWISPELGLYGQWNVTIETQYTAEIVIREIRMRFWLTEGKYIIPFYGWLIKLNASEIQRTSKNDVSVSNIQTYDKRGEELEFSATAEKKITDPTAYEEFDESTMLINEEEILRSAVARALNQKLYWTQILGKEKNLIIEDDLFKKKCKQYGIALEEIVLVVKVTDVSLQSLVAKRKTIVEDLIREKKKATGKTKLTDRDLKDINDQVEILMGKAQKQIIQGVGRSNIFFKAGA